MANGTIINMAGIDTCLFRDLTVPSKEGINVINWGMIFHNLDIELI